MNPTNVNNLITYLLFIGLTLSLLFVYFAQERLYSFLNYQDLTLGSEKYLRSAGVIIIFFTTGLALFASKRKYLNNIYFAYLVLLLFVTINYLITGPGIDYLPGLMDSKGIGPWVALGLIFSSYDDRRFSIFKKFTYVAVVIIAIFVIYNLIDFGIGTYRGQSLAKYRVLATNLVWVCPYVFLILKNNESLKRFRVFVIVIGLLSSLITLTRSFLLIYLLVFIFDFFHTKKKTIYVVLGFIASLAFVYFLLTNEIFSTSLDLLSKRGINDTRTNQLIEFLNQIDFPNMIVGKGFEASWIFNGEPSFHLDNQWLYLIWWAGIIPGICYFYLTAIIPLKLWTKYKLDYETKVEVFILVLWSLACSGLAIYSTMSISFYFYIICLIQGRILYKYSSLNEYR